jgi:O-antigen/teichoic acid export membrane protein
LIVVLGGKGFQASSLVAVLIIGGLLIDQWNGLAHYLLICRDRTLWLQNAWLSCGALNVALCILLVPAFGIEGAAGATLGSFLVLEGGVFYAASRGLPLARMYRFDSTLKAVAASGLAAIAALAALAEAGREIGGLVAATAAFGGVFAVVILLLRELRAADADVLLRAIKVRRASRVAP